MSREASTFFYTPNDRQGAKTSHSIYNLNTVHMVCDKKYDIPVCMNILISQTITARVTKFGFNLYYNCTQHNFVLELDHTPYRLSKSLKTEFHA